MKKLFIFLLLLSLCCSCSDEYKAKRFIKKLDKTNSTFLLKDITSTSAYVFYENNGGFFRQNIRTQKSDKLLQLIEGEQNYLTNNCHLGNGDIFYYNKKREVFRYNLKSEEETCINNNDKQQLFFAGCWYNSLVFFDQSKMNDCDKCIINYNTENLESQFVTFDDFHNEWFDMESKKYYSTTIIVGYKGVLAILTPSSPEDGADLSPYLFHYHFEQPNGKVEYLRCADNINIKTQEESYIIVAETYNTTYIYDLNGKLTKEFKSINGWPHQRGLTSGNIIAKSDEHSILCYIANDDNSFISTINLYYYDGLTGEEIVLDSFKNADGKKIRFITSVESYKHIYQTSNKEGLVLYGSTDFLNEYALLYFDFKTRTTHVIDRGSDITFTRNRFRVQRHNGSIAWYNKDGHKSQPESKSIYRQMGEDLGALINSLF